MDETRDGSRRRHDDPEATGPLRPLPDEEPTAAGDDTERTVSRPARRAPDDEPTTVLSSGDARADGQRVDPTRVASDAPRDWLEPQWPAAEAPAHRTRAGRPSRRTGPRWTRIAAPVVLLAAILAVFTLTVHSGMIGHKSPHTNPTASHGSAKPKLKYYRVRSGDTMGTIAEKLTRKMGYTITVDDLLAANPRVSSTTINPGLRLKIPPAQ